MTTPISALGHVALRKEASFASGGTVDSWQPIDSESVGLVREYAYGDRIQATEEQVGGVEVRRHVAGAITFGVSPQGPGEWWVCGLGQGTTPHSGERPLSSMLLQIDREQAAAQSSGDMITSMAISSSQGSGPDAELKCTVNIEGKDEGGCTAGNPSFASGDAPYVHSEAAFLLNGVANADVTAFSVNIENNNATELYGSDKTRQDIPATKLVCTGSFTILFKTTTEYDSFINDGAARSFQVTFTRGAYSYAITVAKLRYDTVPVPLGGQSEYIMPTFNWTAYVDDSDTENSVAIAVTRS